MIMVGLVVLLVLLSLWLSLSLSLLLLLLLLLSMFLLLIMIIESLRFPFNRAVCLFYLFLIFNQKFHAVKDRRMPFIIGPQ